MGGVSFKFLERDLGWSRLLKAARAASRRAPYVKIGVLGGPRDRRPGESITNVQLALVHEFGAPSRNIPQRSFIRAPFRAHFQEYKALLVRLVRGSLRKKSLDVVPALAIMGEKIAADLKKSAPGTPPPNAWRTLVAKLRKSRKGSTGSPQTLVDTGRMVNSITYQVVRGDEA